MSDDWCLLASAHTGAWQLEAHHLSFPRRLLFALVINTNAGPELVRAVAGLCLLVANLVLFPGVVCRLYPDWSRLRAHSVGLATLVLSTSLEATIWPAICAYPMLLCCLHAIARYHLDWLRTQESRWRVASILATCAAMCTWELGVGAIPLVVALSFGQGRPLRRIGWDLVPHALIAVGYVAVKLIIGSSDVPLRDLVRILGNTTYTPLLQLSPLPLTHGFLTSVGGAASALAALIIVGAAAFSLGRRGWALLAIPFALLAPVLLGPGPAQRYLLITAPWFVLLLWAAALAPHRSWRWGMLGTVILAVLAPVHLATTARTVKDWHRAAAAAERLEEDLTRAASGVEAVVALNVADRLPGWGPTYNIPIWRNGLPQRMSEMGIEVVARGITNPPDPEVLGIQLTAPIVGHEELDAWRRRGVRVLDARPSWADLRGEAVSAHWVEPR